MKTECVIRTAQIVVNGLWNSNDRDPFMTKVIGDGKRPVAANRNQDIQTPLPEMFDRLIGVIFKNNFLSRDHGHLERIRTI